MSENTTIMIQPAAMPTLKIEEAIYIRQQMISFVGKLMKDGIDYGKIPGTGDKPTLLKPGAEKLLTFFGLRTTFQEVRIVEDWSGQEHNGEPFFYYWFRCRLVKNGEIIAEGDGSCNSHESKYRYRKAERTCPKCGAANIRKSKEGGWYCWKKTGGCGATFRDGDASIESQAVGRVLNTDIADQANTILKMAQKRAVIAATLIGVNASEFFTQDIEDIVDGEIVETPAPAPTPTTQQVQDTRPLPTTPAEAYKQGAQDGARDPSIVPPNKPPVPATKPNPPGILTQAEAQATEAPHDEPPSTSAADAEFHDMIGATQERAAAARDGNAKAKPLAASVSGAIFYQNIGPFAAAHPLWQDHGHPDIFHIRVSLHHLGFPKVDDANASVAFVKLNEYALSKEADAASKPDGEPVGK